MKKRILMVLSALLVFGLVAVVVAYNRSSASRHVADSCCETANCCKNGKCSMGGDCCKNHDSCPMKDEESVSAASVDMSNVVVASDKENCCNGNSCCSGGACCKKEKSAS